MTEGIKANEPNARSVYADIIDHPHHQSLTHPRMSMYNRAAQFSSFDALAGYSDMVVEEARLTGRELSLSEEALEVLNQKLNLIADVICDGHNPEVIVVYFVPDDRKSGGEYVEIRGQVKKIDAIERRIILLNRDAHDNEKGKKSKITVDIDRVIEIHGELVDYLDDGVG